MAKAITSKRQNRSERKSQVTRLPLQKAELKNSDHISEILLECIKSGELNSFRDVLATYIMSANKLRLAKKTGLGRQTLYDLIDPTRNFNPELATVSAVIRGLAE